MTRKPIDETYLPFTADKLRTHFIADVEGQLKYYENSANRYHEFKTSHPDTVGIPLSDAKVPRQIEKDERFWTITATKTAHDDPEYKVILSHLLEKAYGISPPVPGLSTWEECLDGELKLYYEVCLPSPQSYIQWLRSNLNSRQIIPYVRDAADRNNARTLEGATHVDAMFLNCTNGFAWLIEAKVLSDISYSISFDNFRNQIARNIDVMIENTSSTGCGLEKRNPERSLFGLLTPSQFKASPHSRLYGWLISDYMSNPQALGRDLSHREGIEWSTVSRRIGWLTFEDFEKARPGSCPWLNNGKKLTI
jgi:hypothetical protein